MGGSRGYIFIDQYWLNQDSSYKEVFILKGVLTPYLSLENNEYVKLHQMFYKNYAIFFGGEGGGGQEGNKDHIILERSLIALLKIINEEIVLCFLYTSKFLGQISPFSPLR